jgi:hypothetical protein
MKSSRQLRIKQNNQQRATAHTIKKWIQATSDFEKARFAIPITRLTSIKSGCVDEVAAAKIVKSEKSDLCIRGAREMGEQGCRGAGEYFLLNLRHPPHLPNPAKSRI